MTDARNKIVTLILEMRQLPELVFDASISFKSTDPGYKRRRAIQELMRNSKWHELTVNISCSTFQTIQDLIQEFADSLGVDVDDITISTTEIKDPWDGFTEDGLVFGISRRETDHEYLERLQELYSKWIKLVMVPVEFADWGRLLMKLVDRIYVARNITCKSDTIEECLSVMDRIYNARNNDHNGEATDVDMFLKQRLLFDRLRKQFLD